MDEESRTVLAKYAHDMHSLIVHGHNAIRRQRDQLKDSEHHDAHAAVSRWESTMDEHVRMIEERLRGMGERSSSPLQDAAASVAGVVAGVYNAVRSEGASKSIRDDYTFFSHAAMSYFMLHTTSKGLMDDETARIADRGYRDMARMCMEIDRMMPGLVIHELRQDGHTMRDVAAECHQLVSDAWRTAATQTTMSP